MFRVWHSRTNRIDCVYWPLTHQGGWPGGPLYSAHADEGLSPDTKGSCNDMWVGYSCHTH